MDTKPEAKTDPSLTLADVQDASAKVMKLLHGRGAYYGITPGNWSVSGEDDCSVFRYGTSAGSVEIAKTCNREYGPYDAKAIAAIPVMLAALELNATVLAQVTTRVEDVAVHNSASMAWRCTDTLLQHLRAN